MPTSVDYRPARHMLELGPGFYDTVKPASFPNLTLRFRNQRWARKIGLDHLDKTQWQQSFAEFQPLANNLPNPLALRYHGHQFHSYNPNLGDGRGFLYAQVYDAENRLLDLATKGSGQTPWSRGGDGRLTLKGGVREILATEMLEALGVYTSKSFSLYETGEALIRNDEPSPTRSSVLTRLGHSHIRFGSFQRHAHNEDKTCLEKLLHFSIQYYAPELCDAGQHAAAMLMHIVTRRSAQLCASWMAAGFVHGVLNTDNMNITGESFDYGPYRFLPALDPNFTAAYFDHTGLYAYGNQPKAVQWNLNRLADALQRITDAPLRPIAATFQPAYETALDRAILKRLGIAPDTPLKDRLLRTSVFAFLETSLAPFEQFFFDWYGGHEANDKIKHSPSRPLYTSRKWPFLSLLRNHVKAPLANVEHRYFLNRAPCTLLIDEIETIWQAIAHHDNWRPFEQKIAAIRFMGEALMSYPV